MENQDNSGVTASGEVRKFDFDQFVAHGKAAKEPQESGMPWSFDFYGWAATHENDDRYILNKGSQSINFMRGGILEVHPDGNVTYDHSGLPAYGQRGTGTEVVDPKPPITAAQDAEVRVAAQEVTGDEATKSMTEVKVTEQIDAMEGEGGGQPVPAPPAPVSHSEHEDLKAKLAVMEEENKRLKADKAEKEAAAKAKPAPAAVAANTKTDKPKSNQPR